MQIQKIFRKHLFKGLNTKKDKLGTFIRVSNFKQLLGI